MKRSKAVLALLLLIMLFGAGIAAGQINSTLGPAAGDAAGTVQAQGIWSVSLKGTQQATMALQQDGDVLYGSASCDGDSPWNAAVLGQISGDRVELTMTSFQDGSIVSLSFMGTIEGESIRGSFVMAGDRGSADAGLFNAVMINPDLTAYSPAEVSGSSEAVQTPAAENNAVAAQTHPTQLGNPKYRDVHTMAGMVPENLGVGFIGDGTMGAGGMGMG